MNRKRNGIARKEKKRKYIDFIGQRRFAVKGQKKGRQRKILFFRGAIFLLCFLLLVFVFITGR
jgi:hypothetical protein